MKAVLGRFQALLVLRARVIAGCGGGLAMSVLGGCELAAGTGCCDLGLSDLPTRVCSTEGSALVPGKTRMRERGDEPACGFSG